LKKPQTTMPDTKSEKYSPESKVKIWTLAARPKTLWASISPVIIGTALAYESGKVHWLSAIIALFGAILIQIGTNFANDYFDHTRGADTKDRLGPQRMTQAGLVTPTAMKIAFSLVFALAFVSGLYLILRCGWPIFIVGALSIIFGILYTAGPYPLGYRGLADLFVLIFFGPVAVGGTYYVQALEINHVVIIAGFSPGLISTAILTVNNLRDIKTDKKAGKLTLAVRFGETFARYEYLISLLLAFLIPVGLWMTTKSHIYSAASLFILIMATPVIKTVFSRLDGPALNKALADTGKLQLIYSIIFSAGWLL